MATMNIYIPDKLKSEMDQVKNINWSNLLQAAIREYLANPPMEKKTGMQTMADFLTADHKGD